MHLRTRSHLTGGRRSTDPLLVSGLTELALGAITGWPYALAISDPEMAKRLGIRSVGRMRQWHLDLIHLGGLATLLSTALPGLPRSVALPLGVGCWTNAMSFGVLVVAPQLHDNTIYRAGAVSSFAVTSWGFVGAAREAVRRSKRGR